MGAGLHVPLGDSKTAPPGPGYWTYECIGDRARGLKSGNEVNCGAEGARVGCSSAGMGVFEPGSMLALDNGDFMLW